MEFVIVRMMNGLVRIVLWQFALRIAATMGSASHPATAIATPATEVKHASTLFVPLLLLGPNALGMVTA